MVQGLAAALDALTYASPLEAAEMRVAHPGMVLEAKVAALEKRSKDVSFFQVAPGGLTAPLAMLICMAALIFYVVHGSILYNTSGAKREAASAAIDPNYSTFDFEFSHNYFNSFLVEAYVYDNGEVVAGLVMCSLLCVLYVAKLRSMTLSWRNVVLDHYMLKASHRMVESKVLKDVMIMQSLPVYDLGTPLGRFRSAVCRVVHNNAVGRIMANCENHRILGPMVGKTGPADIFKYVHRWYKLTLGSGGKYTGVKVVVTEFVEFLVQTNAFLHLGGSDLPSYIQYGGATEEYRAHQAGIMLADNNSVLMVYAFLLMCNCIGTPMIVNFAPKRWTHNFIHLVLKCYDVLLDLGYMAITFWIANQSSQQIFGPGSAHVTYAGTTFGDWFTLWFPFFSVWNSLPDAYEAAMFLNWVNVVMGKDARLFGESLDEQMLLEEVGLGSSTTSTEPRGLDNGKVHHEPNDVEEGHVTVVDDLGKGESARARVKRRWRMAMDRSIVGMERIVKLASLRGDVAVLGFTKQGSDRGASFLIERIYVADEDKYVEELALVEKVTVTVRTLRWLEDHETVTPAEALATLVVSVLGTLAGLSIFILVLVKVLTRDENPICSDTSLRNEGYIDQCKNYGDPFGTCREMSLELSGICYQENCVESANAVSEKRFHGCEVPTALNDNFDYGSLTFTSGKATSLEEVPCYCTAAVVNVAKNYEAGGVVPDGVALQTPGLRSVSLRQNYISQSEFDKAVGKFPVGLVTLDAGGNKLTTLNKNLLRLASLQDISVPGCFITAIDTEFWTLPKLRKVDLSSNCLTPGENKFYPDAASSFAIDSCSSMMSFEAAQNQLTDQGLTSFLQWIMNGVKHGCTLRKFDNLAMWKMILEDKFDFPAYYKPQAMFDDTDLSTVDALLTDALVAGVLPMVYIGGNPRLDLTNALQYVAETALGPNDPGGKRYAEYRPANGLIPWFAIGLSNQPNMTASLGAGTAGRTHLETIATGLKGRGTGTYVGLRCGDLTAIPLSPSVLSDATADQPRVWVDLTCNPICTAANAVRTEVGQGNNLGNKVLILFDNGAGTFNGEDTRGAGGDLSAGYYSLSGNVGTGLTVFCSTEYSSPLCAASQKKGYICIEQQDWSGKSTEACTANAAFTPDRSQWVAAGQQAARASATTAPPSSMPAPPPVAPPAAPPPPPTS